MVKIGRTIFGFNVDSDISFQFLRSGKCDRVLRVVEAADSALQQEGDPLVEWKLRDHTGDVTARLYHSRGIYHFWAGDAGWYRIDPVSRIITIPESGDRIRRELRLWGVPAMLCFVESGEFPLHASAVEIEGKAILFAAPGRFGKTTLALAFHRKGYRILSEDLSCCRLASRPVLLPGPASLRIRPDMFDGRVPDGTKLLLTTPDRVFLAIDETRSGDCRPVPIHAIAFLRESDDEVRLERVETAGALPDLWALSFRAKGTDEIAQSFSALSKLAAGVNVWNLYRPMRLDVLDDVIARIVDACSSPA